MTKPLIVLLIALLSVAQGASAQCQRENKAFKAGESLEYDLYFNWKFIWVKAGSARYKITASKYGHKESIRTDLLFLSNKRCSSVFPMKDTLISHMTPELTPLYFRKGAREGDRYTVEEAFYSYPEGKSRVKLKYLNKRGEIINNSYTTDDCNYDMLSILSVARSFDPSGYKEGHRIHFTMTTSKKLEEQTLVYKGKKEFKANDDVTYRCLVFSLLDYEKGKKDKELLRFYITDDQNHLPVRIDFYLRFGTAKAFFVKGQGLRNPQTSIVKKRK